MDMHRKNDLSKACALGYTVYTLQWVYWNFTVVHSMSTRYTAENSVLQQVAIDMCSGIQQDREEVMYFNLTVNVL